MIAALTVGVALVVGANGSPWAHEQAMGICFNAGVVLIAVAIVAVFVFLVIAPARIHRRLRTDLTILRCENATLKGDDTGTKRFYDLRCELAYLTFSGEADADQQAVALRKFLRCVEGIATAVGDYRGPDNELAFRREVRRIARTLGVRNLNSYHIARKAGKPIIEAMGPYEVLPASMPGEE